MLNLVQIKKRGNYVALIKETDRDSLYKNYLVANEKVHGVAPPSIYSFHSPLPNT